jgi:hypothetical protein
VSERLRESERDANSERQRDEKRERSERSRESRTERDRQDKERTRPLGGLIFRPTGWLRAENTGRTKGHKFRRGRVISDEPVR